MLSFTYSICEHLHCFQIFAITNTAVVNMLVQLPLHTCPFVISPSCIEHTSVFGMINVRLLKQGPYLEAICSREDSWGNPAAGDFSLVFLPLTLPHLSLVIFHSSVIVNVLDTVLIFIVIHENI